MAKTDNPHQPVKDGFFWKCAVEGCHFMLMIPDTSKFRVAEGQERAPQSYADDNYKELFKGDHTDTFNPGRAQDITVEWDILADCSVCEDGGSVRVNDSDGVVCNECGTTWTMDGKQGTRNG